MDFLFIRRYFSSLNNLFYQTTNFGEQGTGILYYQSYRNGDILEFDSGGIVTDNRIDS